MFCVRTVANSTYDCVGHVNTKKYPCSIHTHTDTHIHPIGVNSERTEVGVDDERSADDDDVAPVRM